MGGLTATLVVVGLVALPSGPASAVSTGRPIVVAVGIDGTSYAGFATGGRLLRLDPSGVVDGSIPLDRAEPVTGLDVAPDGNIWVYYGASVSEVSPDGSLLTHFATQSGDCPADRAHDPTRYGGIEATDDAVYVAGRCAATVGIYRRGGDLLATIDLPGSSYPRDVTLAPAAKGLPSRLYVSVPDAGKVYGYNAGSLRSDPQPARTLVIKQFYGFRNPVPGALAADEKGQLAVVDIANNAVHFYNGPEDYWYYRTLGHPPDPASDRGFLDRPTALDHADGSFKKGFWVADSGNGRIQHWDHIGTTDWMTDALPPGDPGAPVNVGLPQISGQPFAGRILDCDTGTWEGTPAAYDVDWLRDGLPVPGADDVSYPVTAKDVSTELTCVVTARSANGASSSPASSEEFPIPGPNSAPYIVERPEIRGQARSGSVLRCSTGKWTDDNPTSYLRGWLRDGQLLPGTNAAEYLVTDNDIYHEVTCRVAAVNRNGTGKAAISDPVLIEEGGGGGSGVDRPENTQRPRIVGQAAVGAVLYCDPGKWKNAPTFSYVWRRDGTAIGGSEKDRYEVLGADKGLELTCLVTGTNPAGSDQASSSAVVPRGSVGGGGGGAGGGGGGSGGDTCRGAPSVRINGGAAYARKASVVLTVRAPAGAESVEISNDAGFRTVVTRSLSSSCRYSWKLAGQSSRNAKVVRVRFPGVDGIGTRTDKIVLDAAQPRLKGVGARWSNAKRVWVLKVRASDRGAGIAKVQVGKSKGHARSVRWGRPVASADSSKLRWVRVIDRAGNASRWVQVARF